MGSFVGSSVELSVVGSSLALASGCDSWTVGADDSWTVGADDSPCDASTATHEPTSNRRGTTTNRMISPVGFFFGR